MSEAPPQVRVEKQPRRGMGKLIAVAVAAVLFLILVVQNTVQVKFSFLFWDFTWPAWSMLLLLFVIGLIVGMLTVALLRRRRRQARRDERRA